MFERIIACFGRYCGTGMMVGLFLVSLIYLFFKEKNKANRLLFVYVPTVTLLIYFCPLWAWVVYRRGSILALFVAASRGARDCACHRKSGADAGQENTALCGNSGSAYHDFVGQPHLPVLPCGMGGKSLSYPAGGN